MTFKPYETDPAPKSQYTYSLIHRALSDAWLHPDGVPYRVDVFVYASWEDYKLSLNERGGWRHWEDPKALLSGVETGGDGDSHIVVHAIDPNLIPRIPRD